MKKPKKCKIKMKCTATVTAYVTLDCDGYVDDVDSVDEIIETDDCNVIDIITVSTTY